MIQKRFGLDIPVFVILQEKLEDILSKAPDWWGTSDKDIYDNLIFVMSPATAEIIVEKIGEPTKELEQICICDNTIFWSFDRNKYCGFGKSRKIIFYREQKLSVCRTENGLNGTHWFTNSQCALFLCSTPFGCYIGGDIIAVRHFSMYNMVKRKGLFL